MKDQGNEHPINGVERDGMNTGYIERAIEWHIELP